MADLNVFWQSTPRSGKPNDTRIVMEEENIFYSNPRQPERHHETSRDSCRDEGAPQATSGAATPHTILEEEVTKLKELVQKQEREKR